MKVLLLTTHLDIGGVSVYTVNLARHLKKAGVDVTVASGGGTTESGLEQDNIPHVTVDIKTKFEFGIKVWKVLPLLIKLVKNGNFDLIHAQTRVAQVLGRLVELRTGVPFITTCHGFYKHLRLGRRLFPCWGNKVIAISESVRRHLVEDFHIPASKTALVYTGIELDRYLNLRPGSSESGLKKRIGISGNAFVVGSVGRYSSVKGFKYLIEAFKTASARRASMQLLIVGDGKEKDSLEEQARESGLSGDVFFASGNDASLEEYLSIIDVFCLPSLSEGLGLSLAEAMAAGRACVASNIEGPSELVSHESSGILVPPKDTGALSEAILRLAADEGLRKRLGEAAREKMRNNFSIKESAARTIEVYKEVVSSER